MNARADQIVAIARSWIGTPYQHQCAKRGAGADCLGLVRGVWTELFDRPAPIVPAYTPDWNEPQGREDLLRAARLLLVERHGAPVPGQVLMFRMKPGSIAKHLGIVSAPDRFIHAYDGHGTCESTLSGPWRQRIAAHFDFPDRPGAS
ncbi:hypothetical protein PARPLA_02866 [Rhodobacteraceae bacterium THAF1]|uniref:peptidase n=1 Tax=Palleronia sp. THAF1 TaxID=2587842 RepID=UPI000F3DC2CC|nr:peptidase [Palleronia sp. THAF1]QFU08268.1 hypothetical protein FIU81_06240 [Palleronia sp. THAF1]VDC28847.1 hypothetical protein PARPLA_02866 [Rhodobacteraceae bacterium THAF1]